MNEAQRMALQIEREDTARELERMAQAVRTGDVIALAVATVETIGPPVRSRLWLEPGAPSDVHDRLASALGCEVLDAQDDGGTHVQ